MKKERRGGERGGFGSRRRRKVWGNVEAIETVGVQVRSLASSLFFLLPMFLSQITVIWRWGMICLGILVLMSGVVMEIEWLMLDDVVAKHRAQPNVVALWRQTWNIPLSTNRHHVEHADTFHIHCVWTITSDTSRRTLHLIDVRRMKQLVLFIQIGSLSRYLSFLDI